MVWDVEERQASLLNFPPSYSRNYPNWIGLCFLCVYVFGSISSYLPSYLFHIAIMDKGKLLSSLQLLPSPSSVGDACGGKGWVWAPPPWETSSMSRVEVGGRSQDKPLSL